MIYKEQEDLGSVNSNNNIAKHSKHIVTSYTLTNNSYQTTATQITSPAIAIKEPIPTTNNNITPSLTNNDRPQTDRVGETLLTTFGIQRVLNTLPSNNNLSDTKANCLSTCLLGATLVVSVLNTLLLSFVVKSIQLNDRGFIYGKVSWDHHLDSTIFELPTKVAERKSISLKSIESYSDDRPLILDKLSDGGVRHTLNNVNRDRSSWFHRRASSSNQKRISESAGKEVESVFLSSTGTISGQGGAIEDVGSNYLSVNVNDHDDNQFAIESKPVSLQIRTNLMVLNQIIEKRTNSGGDSSGKWFLSSLSGPAYQLTTMTSSNVDDTNIIDEEGEEKVERLFGAKNENIRPLLILNGEQQSVTLPSESQLTLNSSSISGSIILDEQLRSSEVTGSLEEDFNIQIRDGNLACKSKETMKLMSRSAGTRITTFEELVLKAPSLDLKSANNLYIQNGVEYFDSLEEDNFESSRSRSNKIDIYDKDDEKNKRINNILTQSGAGQTNRYLRVSANGNEGNNYNLRAYNLVVADGILMAIA